VNGKEFNNYKANRDRSGHVVLRDGRSVQVGARVRLARPGFENRVFMYGGRDETGKLKLFEDGGQFEQLLAASHEVTPDTD
jgi:hypothetical protein